MPAADPVFRRFGRRFNVGTVATDDEPRNLDPSALTETPTEIPYGARGRDPAGYPKVIPVGVPPAVAGAPRHLELPKTLEVPARPFLFAEYPFLVPTGNSGVQLDDALAFPCRTIQIDNYTSIWLLIQAIRRYIPPTSMGWQFPCSRAATQIRVEAAAPPNFTQPAFTAGGVFSVFCYERGGQMSLGMGLNPVP